MRLRLSGLVVFHTRNGQLICDDPVGHRQLALRQEAWALLPKFARWAEPEEADVGLVKQLLAAGILIEEGSPEQAREERLGPWSTWGTAATYYHLASRTLESDAFLTAAEDTARLRGQQPPPEPYKRYDIPALPLPPPEDLPRTLPDVLRRRRTTRRFDPRATPSARQVATMLHWVAGVQHEVEVPGFGMSPLKASPSGGARHPVEVYPVVRRVPGLPAGVYHYAPDRHALETVSDAPDDAEVLRWCGGQSFAARVPVLLIYTAVLARSAWKYPTGRTYRSLHVDVGHLSQTAYLVGTALGLGVFFTAAIRDAAVERVLALDWAQEIPLGVTGLGVPAPAEAVRQEAMAHGGPATFSYPGDEWDGMG
ncbi:SagB family peptide dehydrogenase [Streptosporangiaceae bacterium NEAU-GS5]|nr:SagB family peptide dehydrogenase [Streptosporangiaceae bacterium NEAU-GS5]